MYYRIHSAKQGFFKFCVGGHVKGGNGGGGGVKGMKCFSVHLHVHSPLQIVSINNFEHCRSPSKMKHFTMRGLEIGK
jgi:hypothetical protein